MHDPRRINFFFPFFYFIFFLSLFLIVSTFPATLDQFKLVTYVLRLSTLHAVIREYNLSIGLVPVGVYVGIMLPDSAFHSILIGIIEPTEWDNAKRMIWNQCV